MIMTETEAKKKWCPLARVATTVDTHSGPVQGPIAIGSANRFSEGTHAFCIASGCMAWRVARPDKQKPDMSQFGKGDLGYCGAFGEPA